MDEEVDEGVDEEGAAPEGGGALPGAPNAPPWVRFSCRRRAILIATSMPVDPSSE